MANRFTTPCISVAAPFAGDRFINVNDRYLAQRVVIPKEPGTIWGVFVWKEFKGAPKGTNALLAAMFLFYLIGLGVLILSKLLS